MARRRISEKAGRELEEFLSQSDEQIGRVLASKIESRLNGDAIARLLRRGEIRETMLDAAVSDCKTPLQWLAFVLAIDGDIARAGRAYRTYSLMYKSEFNRQKLADLNMRITKLTQQASSLKRWQAIGLRIRRAERGRPASNQKLAERISAATNPHDSVNSIRLALPRLKLSQTDWLPAFRERVKAAPDTAPKKNRRSFGTL